MKEFEESDEYCPHCDNHFLIEAVEPKARLEVEGDDVRIDSKHNHGKTRIIIKFSANPLAHLKAGCLRMNDRSRKKSLKCGMMKENLSGSAEDIDRRVSQAFKRQGQA